MDNPTQDATASGNENLEKVDTTPQNQQEADTQNAVTRAMTGGDGNQVPEQTPAAAAGESEAATTDTETQPNANEAAQAPSEPVSNDAAEQLESEESETTFTKAEVDKMLADKETELRKDINNQKGENIRLAQTIRADRQIAPYGEIEEPSDQALAFQTDSVFVSHFNANKDLYTDKDIADFKLYRQTGDKNILQSNPTLGKLNQELFYLAPGSSKNPLADLEQRLTRATKLAFGDETAGNRSRQAVAESELRNQEIARSAAAPSGKAPEGKTGGKFTPEQHKIAEGMGTKLSE